MLQFAPTNKEFIQEKLFSFPLSFAIVLLLPPVGVGDAYLILGHSHFMMTLLYQYKMGRAGAMRLVLYLVLFGLLFHIAHLFPNAFTVFVATCLLFHVYFGEARHIKKAFSPAYLLMTLSLVTLLSSWLASALWNLRINGMLVLSCASILAVLACVAFIRKEKGLVVEGLFITLLALFGIFVSLELLGMRPSPLESFGFIVMAHYFATYFNVYRSFTRKGEGKQWIFILESFGMNLLFLAGYIFVYFYLGTNNVLYDYVFHPISFYVWTLMHFITTMDFAGYKNTAIRLMQGATTRMAAPVQIADHGKNPMDDH